MMLHEDNAGIQNYLNLKNNIAIEDKMVDTSFSLLQTNPQYMSLIFVLVVWELVWKGIALWKAARESQKYWFIALLILNTAGILPILYIFLFKKGRKGI
jgi:hypothetical protein